MATGTSNIWLTNIRLVAACLIGLLQAAAFPPFSVAGLAWITPGLMLITALGSTGNTPFQSGYLSGLFFWLATLYWLLNIPFAGGPIVGWLALSAYLALYSGIWLWGMWKLFARFKVGASSLDPSSIELGESHQFLGAILFQIPAWKRMLWAFFGAAFWVALEMIRARLIGGFPWNFHGVSQFTMLPLIQISSYTGVYGVSFLIVWFSIAFMLAFGRLITNPKQRWIWAGELWLPVFVIAFCWLWGMRKITQEPQHETRHLKIALIQPSIPQTLIWDPQETTNRFRKLIELSTEALVHKPDLLVWPEAAVPNIVRYDPDLTYPAITNLIHTHKTWLILGADDADPDANSQNFLFYNSSLLVNPKGEFVKTYRKRRLVMFGEYVPFQPFLPFLKWFTPTSVDFQRGDQPVSFSLDDLNINTSVLICFEDIFPHQVREHVFKNSSFLVNITNDGWFKESAAQWQHAINAIFRAVENRISMVRCANNGLSCWIDPYGRIREPFFDAKGTIYGAGYKIIKLALPSSTVQTQATFYQKHGDIFGWICILLCLTTTLVVRIKKDPFGKRVWFKLSG